MCSLGLGGWWHYMSTCLSWWLANSSLYEWQIPCKRETEIGRNLWSKIKELQNTYWESRQFNSQSLGREVQATFTLPIGTGAQQCPFGKFRNMMCFVVRSPHVLFCPCCICTSRTGPSLNMSSPACLLLLPTLTAMNQPHSDATSLYLRQCIQSGYINAKRVRLTGIPLWCRLTR